jgi:hypothetical protein
MLEWKYIKYLLIFHVISQAQKIFFKKKNKIKNYMEINWIKRVKKKRKEMYMEMECAQ